MLRRLRLWLWAVLRRSSFERDLGDELQAHLEMRIEALVSSGLTPAAARRQARLEFGSLEAYKDRCRAVRHLTLTAIGVAAGLTAAFALTRTLEGLLHDISPADPQTYAAVSAGLAIAALLACCKPAIAAARVDPLTVLRHD